MKLLFSIIFSILFVINTEAQYITEIIEYTPAPGQFINTESFGSPSAAQSIIGTVNGIVSLGAFGGSIIFKFANPVENNPANPYGIDFTVFGNPASATSSEPAAVAVMKDENGNNLPDDTWYLLAGSDYYFSSSIQNYEISYTNPDETVAADVPWTDNQGENGFVYANDYHSQVYYPLSNYFPDINQISYTLNGEKIEAGIDTSNTGNIKSYQRAFGYADNKIRGNTSSGEPDNPYTSETEGMGGDSFDISWAIDDNGNYVDLNQIDFVKVYTCVNADLLQLGELSSEITGAVDIAPDASITGNEDMVVIKDLPPVLFVDSQYPIETFAFNRGRLSANQNIDLSVDLQGATLDENNILNLSQAGTLTLTASFSDKPEISSSITVQVSESLNIKNRFAENIKIFPNPADDFIQINGINNVTVSICNFYGREIIQINNCPENQKINISQLKQGIYFIKITKKNLTATRKVIISRF